MVLLSNWKKNADFHPFTQDIAKEWLEFYIQHDQISLEYFIVYYLYYFILFCHTGARIDDRDPSVRFILSLMQQVCHDQV